MPLGLRLRELQDIKDEIIFELKERGLSLDELAHIFGMTRQGIHKAYTRYKRKLLTKS